MTKPNYEIMTTTELKNYLLKHRNDEEGWQVFFEKLALENESATWYQPIDFMTSEEIEAILKEKL
jgi:hypothetical protein